MSKVLFVAFFIFLHVAPTASQQVINKEFQEQGKIKLSSHISIPKINSGYTLWLPDNSPIKGLIVFTHARRDTLNQDILITEALKKKLAVIYITTDNRLDFYFQVDHMNEVVLSLKEIIESYNIPDENLMFCGMSLEGTRALKLAIFSTSRDAAAKIRPRAIAICDAPLDMIRFHKEMIKAKELNFKPVASNEGTWVAAYLEANLGGTPETARDAYISYSPYSYGNEQPHQLKVFDNIAVRAYTEPDINWWIENRGKDYYGMNAIDMAAFINTLKLRGNKEASLLLTQNKGYDDEGNRHPHNWNIVDEKELVIWFSQLINQ